VEFDVASSSQSSSVAELSRPRRQYKADSKKNNKPQGRKRKAPRQGAERTNWKSPFLWSQIETAAVLAGRPWSPREIVLQAKRLDLKAFKGLTEQVVGRWIDPDDQTGSGIKWKESVLEYSRLRRGMLPAGNQQGLAFW
jgi:hypothetical protein